MSASACTAAGYYANSSEMYKTLIESWNGTRWSVVPGPNRGPVSKPDYLDGVSCASATACTAAGSYLSGGEKTLIESD